ncbi:BnaC09g31070D [Brassica napus]|uniref:BnaC09g31070D protein n=1 Tax=Brassica napus TaxID=3708 RepID=A0A078I934_BRANA|nr:BnaC09g31070D [Brassica napus]
MAELRMTHRHATEDELRQLRDNGFAAWLRSYVCYISYPRVTYRDDPWVTVTQINPRGRVDGTSDDDEPLQPESTSNAQAVEDLENVQLVENLTVFGHDAGVHSEPEAEVGGHFEGGQKGKALTLFFTRPQSTTPCGLPISTSDEVVNVTATFASSLVGAITFLESYWKEMCSNIRNGHVSEWITDLSCRDAVTNILGGGNSELADRIEKECNTKSWEGIFTRLWPKVKFIQSTVTGQNSQCIPMLEFYSNNVPLISTVYASSETMFGINMNPFCKPQDVSYTFIPTLSYFEFILADEGNKGEIVDLVNVKIGSYYEPLITNYYGLHRYRMGDILQVSGFYNDAPQFRFVRRKNVALSVSLEVTTEEDILKALNNATLVLKSSDLVLMGFTCYADISTLPGHYIFYWELKSKTISDIVKLDNKVLVECCCVMEESLCALYRELRSKDGSIGALEIRVVQQETFNSLMELAISQGASPSQYKTPICINSSEASAVLESNVLACFFSDKSPTL